MSAGAIVWTLVGVLFVALLVAAAVQAARAAREARRAIARVDGYADLPVVQALSRAETDVARIGDAVDRIPALVERAAAALARIRGL